MDIKKLHSNICLLLCSDLIISTYLNSLSLCWSINSKGFLLLNNEIYIPDTSDLWLHILQYKHDHLIFGHFGQNWTMELVWCKYIWPKPCDSMKSYIKSCTTCMHSKSQRHHPYGLLKQLLIPETPWNSIFMAFSSSPLPSYLFAWGVCTLSGEWQVSWWYVGVLLRLVLLFQPSQR